MLRMLYDFLQYQNGVKENSIHATYLLYGQKKTQETQTDGDVDMGSSQPEHDDATEDVVTDTLTLVAEESLKGQQRVPRKTLNVPAELTICSHFGRV